MSGTVKKPTSLQQPLVLPLSRDDVLAMPAAYHDILSTGEIVQVVTPSGDNGWLVSRFEHIRHLLAGDSLSRSHPDPQNAPRYSGDVFAAPVGKHETYHEDHARIRRVLTRAFTAKRMRALTPKIQGIADELIDRFSEHERPADFRQHFALPMPAEVISELLGVPEDARPDLMRWSDAAQATDDFDGAIAALVKINSVFVEMVKQKRRRPADDILSELVQAHDEGGRLTDEELIRIAHTLLFSGFTSSVARIEFGTVLLLANPETRDAFIADPGLAPQITEEVLRIAMPSMGAVPRWAVHDFGLAGKHIKAGDLVLLGHEIANHDPAAFPDPERFDIRRTGNTHLAFGYGNYFCVGAVLSRLELHIALRSAFSRLPALRLAVDRTELRLRERSLIGGFETLPVAW
ncbi:MULTISPECIES: cytochrome P450 [Amycolatopsis]|uniref:Cytochrome P450 n=1 Tax=Amycolatopsis albidoflavus TaxID=102226 RepID=A0ABW5I7G0_9PSEU